MNDLKVFSSTEFGELGVMLIDGKEYFPATQCAKILGYASPKDAITRHCKGALKRRLPTAGGEQYVKFIPEGDLYRLIVSSKLPSAEKFERWVFDEVLPTLRKTGSYGAVNIEEIIARTATAVVTEVIKQLSINKIAEQPQMRRKPRKSMSIITQLSPELHKAVDEMLLSNKYTFSEVCSFLADYGVVLSVTSVWRYYKRLTAEEVHL